MSNHIVTLYNMHIQHVTAVVFGKTYSPIIHHVGKDYIAIEIRDTENGRVYFGNIALPDSNVDVLDYIFIEMQKIISKNKEEECQETTQPESSTESKENWFTKLLQKLA